MATTKDTRASNGKSTLSRLLAAGTKNFVRKIAGGILPLAAALFSTNQARADQPPLKLWYEKPATVWMYSALPIGNGEFGAMFFGGVGKEQIQFNEKTVWAGSTTSRGAYQNFGDLYLEFQGQDKYTDYYRELSLDDAMGRVSYTSNGVRYEREYLASNPDSAVIIRLTTPESTGKLNFTVTLQDAHSGTTTASGNNITMKGNLDILVYEAQVQVANEGGTVTAANGKLTVANADAVTIILTGATNFDLSKTNYTGKTSAQLHGNLSARISSASAKSYAGLKAAHENDYQPKFSRVKLDLGIPMPDVPTDLLVTTYKESTYLDVLYFQYGRYLMLSSSRGMDLPNNLQGLWNNSNNPPWQCDIHTNINIQMNYWPVENTNLSEIHLPFLNYVRTEALKPGGSWPNMAQKTSSESADYGGSMTGYRGWTLKTQTNIFGYSDWKWNRPVNAWYCMHLWQHYQYTNDTTFLSESAYPVMKSACEFWFDRLKEVDGELLAPYEWSPEQGAWQDGLAYAQQLIWELFDQTLKAAAALSISDGFVSELNAKFAKLDNGVHVGSWKEIREWKYAEPSGLDRQGNTHRHISHLIALYPGNQISYLKDSTYADAAKVSLNSRGDEGTGWSRAWKIAAWARLRDGDHAYKLLKQALNVSYTTVIDMDVSKGGVYENLLDAHPPFQIDGNSGATAGIAEMLLQSNLGYIDVLPALPSAWPNGNYEGLKAIGNFTVGVTWKNSKPTQCKILSGSGNVCKIYRPGFAISVKDTKGQAIAFDTFAPGTVSFPTTKGAEYMITFSNASAGNTITPGIQINDGEVLNTSSAVISMGDKLLLSPRSDTDGGTWSWIKPDATTSAGQTLLIGNAQVKQSGTYIVSYTLNGIVSTYSFSVIIIDATPQPSLNAIPVGDYYIGKRGVQSYWTNTNVAGTGGTPSLQTLGYPANALAQVWTLSLDGGYYKLVSKADGRYINEKGNFGTNSYYSDWNTYNIYSDDTLNCAIQITQKSATQEKGAWFLYWNSGNTLSYTTNTTVDTSKDLAFTFVPYTTSGIKEAKSPDISVSSFSRRIYVKSDSNAELYIYNLMGELVKYVDVDKTANISVNPGVYLLKFKSGRKTKVIKTAVS